MTVGPVFAFRGSAFGSIGRCGLGGWFRFKLRRRLRRWARLRFGRAGTAAGVRAPPRLHAAMLRARALLSFRTAERSILALRGSVLRRIRGLLCERGDGNYKDCGDEQGSDETASDHTALQGITFTSFLTNWPELFIIGPHPGDNRHLKTDVVHQTASFNKHASLTPAFSN